MILLAAISLAGIIAVQVYWVARAVEEQEQAFDHNVRMSLRSVADSMCQIDGNDLIDNKPIDKVTSNYFVARLQYNINISNLERLISEQFETRGVNIDYEYGVYNCETDRMVFGELVSQEQDDSVEKIRLPELKEDEYYFGVYFPSKTAGLLSNMSIWKFMTAGTVLMLLFFGYGLVVVLKQRRLSEIQKDFINNVTHELKTPLATLKLAAEVINKNTTGDKSTKYAKIVCQETNRLEAQVEQILSTSLAEHTQEVSMEKVEASTFLNEIVEKFKLEYSDVQWEIELKNSDDVLKTNCQNLEAILRNLVDNAVKYGNGEVGISTDSKSRNLEIIISDNGSGIPRIYQKKIFDKFFRIPSNNQHDVKGYGLGMYLVKASLKQIRGSIQINSTPEGTSFTVSLPKGQ
ncbi:MAG: HAMP domain-containing histidine kinase [Cytophagales bacterium]|nr:HAMP domain-containing histidine kinase [Cytophagales bacterium]